MKPRVKPKSRRAGKGDAFFAPQGQLALAQAAEPLAPPKKIHIEHWCEECAAEGVREWGSFGEETTTLEHGPRTTWRCFAHWGESETVRVAA